jgi:hypothetical protein
MVEFWNETIHSVFSWWRRPSVHRTANRAVLALAWIPFDFHARATMMKTPEHPMEQCDNLEAIN